MAPETNSDRPAPTGIICLVCLIVAILALGLWFIGAAPPLTGQETTPTVANYLPVVAKQPTPTVEGQIPPLPEHNYIPYLSKPIAPTSTPPPLITPVPGAPNLLPNPSFEEGWSHPGGIPEIQVPNSWSLAWDEGENPLDPDPWNVFVRPESRLLSRDFLPPEEHELFIWDGDWTVKIFKGSGSISFRLTTEVYLPAGRYLFQIHTFPDLIVGYTDTGEKIWAPDPLSGEVQFLVDGSTSTWWLPTFGQKNTLQHVFTVSSGRTVDLGVAFRNRWAIRNNGWFMDDWSLTQLP